MNLKKMFVDSVDLINEISEKSSEEEIQFK
jgi:hypothetical protein